MSDGLVMYMAHPVAPSPVQMAGYAESMGRHGLYVISEHQFVQRTIELNLENARRWLRFLVEHTDWAICAPWMPYVQALGDGDHRERGLRDDCRMAARCDGIVLCGGRVSTGMARERDAVLEAGGPVLDLTDFGATPPDREEGGRLPDTMAASIALLERALGRLPAAVDR